MNEKMWNVYQLRDPNDGLVRYVGKTTRADSSAAWTIRCRARKWPSGNPLLKWVTSIDGKFKMEMIVSSVKDSEVRGLLEALRTRLRSQGHPILELPKNAEKAARVARARGLATRAKLEALIEFHAPCRLTDKQLAVFMKRHHRSVTRLISVLRRQGVVESRFDALRNRELVILK